MSEKENTVRLDLFKNPEYKPGKGMLTRLVWYFCNILFLKNAWFPFSTFRIRLLRMFGAEIGQGVVLKPSVNIKYPWHLKIGDHVWIGEQVWIDNLTQVEIQSHVCISQGAVLLTGNHNYTDPAFALITGAITIETGAWVGAGAMVCPGVKIGSHAVLSVCSVATHNLEPWGIYQGNPAQFKKIRKLK